MQVYGDDQTSGNPIELNFFSLLLFIGAMFLLFKYVIYPLHFGKPFPMDMLKAYLDKKDLIYKSHRKIKSSEVAKITFSRDNNPFYNPLFNVIKLYEVKAETKTGNSEKVIMKHYIVPRGTVLFKDKVFFSQIKHEAVKQA